MQRLLLCTAPLVLLTASREPLAGPEVVTVPAGLARYHLPGSSDVHEEVLPDFSNMRRQVSQDEYTKCVEEGACSPLEARPNEASADLTAVGLSWQDANAMRGGYRSVAASASDCHDIASGCSPQLRSTSMSSLPPMIPATPHVAGSPTYAQRANRVRASIELKPFGGYGCNEHGLLDVAGNVW